MQANISKSRQKCQIAGKKFQIAGKNYISRQKFLIAGTKRIITGKNVKSQANLEEFMGKEKVEDESDSDDTDSGIFQL